MILRSKALVGLALLSAFFISNVLAGTGGPTGGGSAMAGSILTGTNGNPAVYPFSGTTIGPVSNIVYAGTGTLSAAFTTLGSNPGVVIANPGQTYNVSAPLKWGTTNDQTLLVYGKINCTDTTGGRDCLEVDVHGHLIGVGPGSGGSNNGCLIGDSATANITSLVTDADHTAADGFDLRNCLLDPNTNSTITKAELWLSGAEGFNTVENVKMTQPPVGGSNSGIEYAVDDAGGTRQWNQIDNFAVSVTCGAAAGATGISITATAGGGGSNFTFLGGAVVDCGTTSTYVNIAGNSSVQPKNIHFIDTYFEPDGSGDFIDINDAYGVTFDNVYFNQANASTQTNCVDIKGTAGNVGVVKISGRAAPSACTHVINNEISGYAKDTAGNINYIYLGTNGAPIFTIDGLLHFIPVVVASLPGTCTEGDIQTVKDWNGTNGTCTGGGSNRTVATCGGSNTWYCP